MRFITLIIMSSNNKSKIGSMKSFIWIPGTYNYQVSSLLDLKDFRRGSNSMFIFGDLSTDFARKPLPIFGFYFRNGFGTKMGGPPRVCQNVWGLKTQPKSGPLGRLFKPCYYLQIVFLKFSDINHLSFHKQFVKCKIVIISMRFVWCCTMQLRCIRL